MTEITPTENKGDIVRKSNNKASLSDYAPIHCMISLSLLSIHELDPFISSQIFITDPTSVLVVNSTIGAASYLCTKNPFKRLKVFHKIIFSINGGMIFSLAAMYGWRLCSEILPDIPILNSIIGVATTYGYIKICQRFVSTVN